MLERDWRSLVADGKADINTNTASFSLLDFENEIAHVQKYGVGSSVPKIGGSFVAGNIHERLKTRTRQELTLCRHPDGRLTTYSNKLNMNP